VDTHEKRLLEATDFSLTDCGLLDRLFIRLGWNRPPEAPRLIGRATAAALFAWLPLLVFWVLGGQEGAAIPFSRDIGVHVRFLVVIPLLILAEGAIGQRTRFVAAGFMASGLIAEDDKARFEAAVRRTRRLLDSTWVDVLLLVVAYGIVWALVRTVARDGAVFWFEQSGAAGEGLSPAGWWYALVSVPTLGFLFLRWAWRYGVWSLFLNRLSRLNLQLTASHPDRSGGLAFINLGHTAFAFVSVATSLLVSAAVASRMVNEAAPLKSFQSMLIGFVVLALLVGLLPLMTFMRPLVRTKRRALIEYSELCSRYVRSFERKWIAAGAEADEAMLGSGDIQSLADLGGSFERVQYMRILPFDQRTVIGLAVAAAAPMVPLLLMIMPLREMIALIVKAMI
jgi:hypothetical protein